jgi:hypothetical protein
MTPEEHAYAHRLGHLYDRLVHLWDLPTSVSHPELLDLVRVYGYDDVEFMLNVIKEDMSHE